MKITILSLMIALTISSLSAGMVPSYSIENNTSFVLNLNSWKANDVDISLKTDQGESLYSERVDPSQKSTRKYNLGYLPKGTYFIQVSDDLREVEYRLEVTKKRKVIVVDENTFFHPFIKLKGEKLDVNMLPLGKEVTIYCYDQFGELLYSDKFDNQNTINKRLDISQLEAGDYNLNITIGKRHFYQPFTK